MRRFRVAVMCGLVLAIGSCLWVFVFGPGAGDAARPVDLSPTGGLAPHSEISSPGRDGGPGEIEGRDPGQHGAFVRSSRLGAPLRACEIGNVEGSGRAYSARTSGDGEVMLPIDLDYDTVQLIARFDSMSDEVWPINWADEGAGSSPMLEGLVCDLVSVVVDCSIEDVLNAQGAFFSSDYGAQEATIVAMGVLGAESTVIWLDERDLPGGGVPDDLQLYLRVESRLSLLVGVVGLDLDAIRSGEPASINWMETGSLFVDAASCFGSEMVRADAQGLSIGFDGRMGEGVGLLPPSVLRWFLLESLDGAGESGRYSWKFSKFPAGGGWTCILRVAAQGRFERKFSVDPRRNTDLSFCDGDGTATAYVTICQDLRGVGSADTRWGDYWATWSESPPIEIKSYDGNGLLVGARTLGAGSTVGPVSDARGRWEVPVAADGPSKLVVRDWRSPRTRMQPSVFGLVSPGDVVETCPVPYPSGQFCIVEIKPVGDPFMDAAGPLTLFLVRVRNEISACLGETVIVHAYRLSSPADLKHGLVVPADGLVGWCVTAEGSMGAAGPAEVVWGGSGVASDAYYGTMLVEFELVPGQGHLAVARWSPLSDSGEAPRASGDAIVASWLNSMPEDLKLPVSDSHLELDIQSEGRAMLVSAEMERAAVGWCGVRDVEYFIGSSRLSQYEVAPGVILVRADPAVRIEECLGHQIGFRSVPVRLANEYEVIFTQFELD